MNYRPFIIEVSGNVLAKEGRHYAQGWVCGSCLGESVDMNNNGAYDTNTHSIEGDLYLDKTRRAVPYALYVASGSMSVDDKAPESVDLICAPGFFPAFAYFKEYIGEIRSGLEGVVGEYIKDLYYNGLYVSAFSVLELFFVISCCVVCSQKRSIT